MNTYTENEAAIAMAFSCLSPEGRAKSRFAHLHDLGRDISDFANMPLAERIIRVAAKARGENVLPFIPGPRQPDRAGFTTAELIAAGGVGARIDRPIA